MTTTTQSKPEFFRLPARGGDPYFGLTRAFLYAAEKRGDLRLVRIRGRGKQRGITLVPYDAVAEFIRKHESTPVSASTIEVSGTPA